MNQDRFIPTPFPKRVIQDKFPEKYPIFWGPNQRILEDGKYVEPSGFISNRALIVPKIVRFIHDAHQEVANADECELFGPTHIDAFARPATPAYGERPWALTGSIGTWFPDATDWFASTVVIVKRPDPDPGFGATEFVANMPVSDALANGYLEYYQFAVTLTWGRDGILTTTTLLLDHVPVIVYSSDRPHLLESLTCANYPTGCPCEGP